MDPELQDSYVGDCKGGLAEGQGAAVGTASYAGAFVAGRKQGSGVKTWPSTGDRYEGAFSEDRKEGMGTYIWGPRSAWPGERYSGTYLKDRRHGQGVYEWPNGDRYAGPWENDSITGAPTAAMFARAQAHTEHAAVTGKVGAKVCREMTVGIGTRDWVRGVVLAVRGEKIEVRIDDPGKFQHTISNIDVVKGKPVLDFFRNWIPCR